MMSERWNALEEENGYILTRSRPHLNFSEATGLFQTNLSQLGTICLQTRNTKTHHTYWILQHSEWSARPKECNLQPFTKPGGNTNRSKPAWPISKLGLYGLRFDDDRRFYQPCTLWQRSKNHHPLVQVIQLCALGFLITGYSFMALGCFLFLVK